jgi:hypothetical protein
VSGGRRLQTHLKLYSGCQLRRLTTPSASWVSRTVAVDEESEHVKLAPWWCSACAEAEAGAPVAPPGRIAGLTASCESQVTRREAAGVERRCSRAERVAMCCGKEMGVKDWEKVVPKVVLWLGRERRRKEDEWASGRGI